MARKTLLITIGPDGGRDAGKCFLLTEKDAVSAEKWATRALLAIANAGVDIPPEVLRMGAGAVVAAGVRAMTSMAFADAEPLLDEMMQCVAVLPDPKRPDVVRPLDGDDIEEIRTLLQIRSGVIELHVGFSIADFLSKLGTSAQADEAPNSSDIPTSLK